MTTYYRPLAMTDPVRPADALPLAGGWCWFNQVERLNRDSAEIIAANAVPSDWLDALTAPRAGFAGLYWDAPRLMGILNVTPDSFSDGGQFLAPDAARSQGKALAEQGADIIDIGGESTRPGADVVPVEAEVARVAPVIHALQDSGIPLSIDTRKAPVAKAALEAGAAILNDVSALQYDPAMAGVAAEAGAPICLMHAQGDPATMQQDPRYEHALLDVYDALAEHVANAARQGIARSRIIVDPGIGFGKTLEHNLELIRGLSLFHGLGCVVLLGASRKRFIGTLSGADTARDRVAGSLAVNIAGVAQGVQILRVHDIKETKQAMALQKAIMGTR